jgi:hypothetical protein
VTVWPQPAQTHAPATVATIVVVHFMLIRSTPLLLPRSVPLNPLVRGTLPAKAPRPFGFPTGAEAAKSREDWLSRHRKAFNLKA